MTSRFYYTLAVIGEPGDRIGPSRLARAQFRPEFGDYDKETVKAELQEYRDRGYKVWQLWILTSGESQGEIDAILAKFNTSYWS